MTDHDLNELLNAIRDEDASHLGSVRGRVMARIESKKRRRNWTIFPAAIAAATMAAIFLLVPRIGGPQNSTKVEPRVTEAATVRGRVAPARALATEPALPPSRATNVRERATVSSATQRPKPAPALTGAVPTSPAPLEVRMQTDDPDVLIIWQVGEEDEGTLKGNR